MRQITIDSVSAFRNGLSFSRQNMKVVGMNLYLHNNRIAWIENGKLYLSSCGWRTVTTKERLNGVLDVFGLSYGIYQRNFEWYINIHPEYSKETELPFVDGMQIDLRTNKILK